VNLALFQPDLLPTDVGDSLAIESNQLKNREAKMQDTILSTYCLCDDFLKAMN